MRLTLRTRERFRRAIAAAATGLVLALTVLAVCPSLHAWLHGEKQIDADDGCAVVLFAHGVTTAAGALILAAALLVRLPDTIAAPAEPTFSGASFVLPPGRGPPAR